MLLLLLFVCQHLENKVSVKWHSKILIKQTTWQNLFKRKALTFLTKLPFFNEFVVELPRSVKEVNRSFLKQAFIGGYDLGKDYGLENQMLIAVTEQRTKEEIDQFVEALEAVVNG